MGILMNKIPEFFLTHVTAKTEWSIKPTLIFLVSCKFLLFHIFLYMIKITELLNKKLTIKILYINNKKNLKKSIFMIIIYMNSIVVSLNTVEYQLFKMQVVNSIIRIIGILVLFFSSRNYYEKYHNIASELIFLKNQKDVDPKKKKKQHNLYFPVLTIF